MVEGKNLLERDSIEKLRDLITDLQLIEGTRGIISLFSARQPPHGNELPAPLIPERLPEGAESDRLVQRVMTNEIIRGKLLSEDGDLTLIVLALDPDVVASSRLRDVIGEIRKTINEDLAGTQLTDARSTQATAVTGLSAIATRNSALMINKLNRGLMLEFVFVAAFIGLAFRSVVVMLASVLPGIFPIVLSGMVLWALGEGLQFASVVALTVSFGLPERHNPFLKPAAAGESAGSGSGHSGGTGNRAGWSAFDPDLRRACVRLDRNGLLGLAVAAPVWLVERVRHAGGVGCGPADSAAHGYIFEQARTPGERNTTLPVMTNKEMSAHLVLVSATETSVIS